MSTRSDEVEIEIGLVSTAWQFFRNVKIKTSNLLRSSLAVSKLSTQLVVSLALHTNPRSANAMNVHIELLNDKKTALPKETTGCLPRTCSVWAEECVHEMA